MQRVEKQIVKKNKRFDELTHLSKNLYNYVNYQIRQEFIKNKKMLNEYDLLKKLRAENQVDFRALPSASSGQIMKVIFTNWKSFFKANKDFKKNPSKYKGRPKPPNYKPKDGHNVMVFDGGTQIRLIDNFIHFPASVKLNPVKTGVKTKVKQVRIVPKKGHHVIEIVYEKEEIKHKLNEKSYLGIDLGINNLITTSNNAGLKPFIVNGKIIKSINQYYNKKKAKLMSYVGDKGTSNKIEAK